MNAGVGILEWSFKGRKLLTYAFGANQFKPYVRELYTLAGDNVLRDAVPDHLHHHGLMYAIRVNGVNFWEEREEPGHERSVKLLAEQVGRSSDGHPQASFTQLIHWIASKDAAAAETAPVALLMERRTLTLTVDEAQRELALHWHGDFEVGAQNVRLHGSEYNGLGLRLPQPFDHVARFQNSDNVPYSAPNTHDVIAARWSAVSHQIEGRDIMIALFARPAGTPGGAKFFTMLEPFAYLSVTQGLDKAPLEYSAGGKFSLDYLLTLYPEIKTAEFLQRRGEAWEHGQGILKK